jgi:predicted DNA-binding transcriptional regulator AlpA
MKIISTRQAAKKLGLHFDTLSRYIAVGKLPAPTILEVGTRTMHAWTEEEIEHVRQLLPKIANGRKTRYSKLREKQKAPAKSPVPRKSLKRKTRKPKAKS